VFAICDGDLTGRGIGRGDLKAVIDFNVSARLVR